MVAQWATRIKKDLSGPVPAFSHKIKTKLLMKNLRYISLYINVLDHYYQINFVYNDPLIYKKIEKNIIFYLVYHMLLYSIVSEL